MPLLQRTDKKKGNAPTFRRCPHYVRDKIQARNQYLGTDGSTSSDQARMPPFRLRILRKPALRRKSTASAERLPLRQWATISLDESSSWTRRVNSPSGIRCPLRLQL